MKTPKLLLLGLIRFAAVIFITVLAVGFIVAYHLQLVDLVWSKPASLWLVWLWHLVAWLLVLLLAGGLLMLFSPSVQIGGVAFALGVGLELAGLALERRDRS